MIMYHSYLLIDTGDNPDRPRPGRLWLRNVYRVHQRLCMAFPNDARKREDPEFLKPYDPNGFVHVHGSRTTDQAFLFRIDAHAGGSVVIVTQSAVKPDWAYAFQNAMYLLHAPPSEPREAQLTFPAGTLLGFRLLANPTRRLRESSRDAKGEPIEGRWAGKRVPVPTGKLDDWLTRRSERCGFAVETLWEARPGFVYFSKSASRGEGQCLRSVRYEGKLRVSNSAAFRETLIRGIGPGKAFGFGLLSVAPGREGG